MAPLVVNANALYGYPGYNSSYIAKTMILHSSH